MPKIFSGKDVVKILSREFGFYFVSQRGSHIKLRRKIDNKTFTTVVPLHKELAPGTLRSSLELGGVELEKFLEVANN